MRLGTVETLTSNVKRLSTLNKKNRKKYNDLVKEMRTKKRQILKELDEMKERIKDILYTGDLK